MSRTAQIVLVVLLALLVLALCAVALVLLLRPGAEPSPTAIPETTLEPTFTPTPGAAEDDSWERIQAAGKMVVGTSADYPPFEYMTEDHQIDGFDVALMNAIGQGLGIPIEWHNLAFDGLGDALQLGQIDVAIAGISVTDDRLARVDFSDVYFVGEDAVLASASSPLDNIDEAGDLSTLRVGAQRGTVYEYYLESELVDTGKLPKDQLFVYGAAPDAVRDLRQDRLDLVMMDAQPAQSFVNEGGVKIAGGGLNQQRFAVALPKGASSLQAQINGALLDLQNQGVIAQLAKQYLNLDPEHILPTPTPTPPPAATSTPAPPPACLDGLALVEHLNYDDKNMSNPPVMNPSEAFTKGWRVTNTGTCTWDSSYTLVFAGGNKKGAKMSGEPVAVQGQVAPGATYDIYINLVAPPKGGTYQGFWQMEDGTGSAFGEKLPVGIRVAPRPTSTPPPTQTPVPDITFTVDRDHIDSGECVNFYWKVENVQDVYFYHDGQDWKNNGVAGEASKQECPPFTLTYYLRVVYDDGSVKTPQITINVKEAPDKPQITRFNLHPSGQIQGGQSVKITWDVEGAVNYVGIYRDDTVLWDGAPTSGNMPDTPTGPPGKHTYTYKIKASGPGGESQAHRDLEVSGSLPPSPPPPDDPVIDFFSVTPSQIEPGNCVDIKWQTSGGTTFTRIVSEDRVVYPDAPLSGTHQDCPPDGPGATVPYRVIAYNAQDKRIHQVQEIQIMEPLK
jgi:polar amino acid transport system substrate-binding protein